LGSLNAIPTIRPAVLPFYGVVTGPELEVVDQLQKLIKGAPRNVQELPGNWFPRSLTSDELYSFLLHAGQAACFETSPLNMFMPFSAPSQILFSSVFCDVSQLGWRTKWQSPLLASMTSGAWDLDLLICCGDNDDDDHDHEVLIHDRMLQLGLGLLIVEATRRKSRCQPKASWGS